MAQNGNPPGGWYTDPSGQHVARYWDGAAWTEQVRDDLADPSSGAAGGSSAAATVAGVAEAVAAVAASGVIQPAGGEPPLIVDYGSDYTPWVTGGGANAGSAPSIDPFADPAFFLPNDAPFAPSAFGTPAMGDYASSTVGVTTNPMVDLASMVDPVSTAPIPMPVTTGPAPDWYPDPAARHQARLWDGMQWTERVADNGVEARDPLPGMPTGAAAATAAPVTHDPTVGGWTEQLLDPAGPAGALADGSLSAGQASLATLPWVEGPDGGSTKERARPTVKVRVAGGMVLGGAIALLLGSGMSWMEMRGPKVGDATSATGVDLGDGRITLVLAVVLAVLGAVIMTGRLARMGGARVAAMGALVAGAAALAVTAVEIADVADRAARLGVPPGAVTDVGTGLWLCFVGSLCAVGGGLLAFANRK